MIAVRDVMKEHCVTLRNAAQNVKCARIRFNFRFLRKARGVEGEGRGIRSFRLACAGRLSVFHNESGVFIPVVYSATPLDACQRRANSVTQFSRAGG